MIALLGIELLLFAGNLYYATSTDSSFNWFVAGLMLAAIIVTALDSWKRIK